MKYRVAIKAMLSWFFVVGAIWLAFNMFEKQSSGSIAMIRDRPVRFQNLVEQARQDSTIVDYLQKGDTLHSILRKHISDSTTVREIERKVRAQINENKLRQGTKCEFVFSGKKNKLTAFSIWNSFDTKLVVEKESSGNWKTRECTIEKFSTLVVRTGVIKSSFWNDAVAEGVPPSIILDFADLFGWRVDFACDLRKKDAFKIIYSKIMSISGECKYGPIEAAVLSSRSNTYYAFRFFSRGDYDYFDEHGQSVKRSFLKSPLRYRYISSYYSKRRYHPILKKYRPHLGIDYAAPTGTPVTALGDGIICFKGWKGGYGNYLEIKHGSGYSSCYGHLSRFAKGIKKGVFVKQGSIIGYVGSTGLSTGPHLDFRMKYHGKFVNPLTIQSPPARPIEKTEWEAFSQKLNQWKEYISGSIIHRR